MMNYWKWTAFFSPDSLVPKSGAKSFLGKRSSGVLVHFFPSATGTSAPYPVHAFVEIFSGGRVLTREGFEGLRLNQPDGLNLCDVFPEFHDVCRDQLVGEHIGLNLELGTNQPRVNLSRSRILIEFVYPTHRVRFHAKPVTESEGSEDVGVRKVSVVPDSVFSTKVVEIAPHGKDREGREDAARESSPAGLLPSQGYSLRSFSAGDESRRNLGSGGLQEGESSAELATGSSGELVRYLVQSEGTSELPISVRAL